MKKLFFLLVFGMFLLAYACGGGGDDPKAVMNETVDAMENLVSDLNGADSADKVVTALDKFSDTMTKLKPKVIALQEKFPELKNLGQAKLPEKYKEIEDRMKETMPKMMAVFGKIAQYASDPKVVEAQKRMQEAMR